MGGAFFMGTFMLIIACITATHPPAQEAKHITASGRAAIAMVYAEAASYNLSWGPVAWQVLPIYDYSFPFYIVFLSHEKDNSISSNILD